MYLLNSGAASKQLSAVIFPGLFTSLKLPLFRKRVAYWPSLKTCTRLYTIGVAREWRRCPSPSPRARCKQCCSAYNIMLLQALCIKNALECHFQTKERKNFLGTGLNLGGGGSLYPYPTHACGRLVLSAAAPRVWSENLERTPTGYAKHRQYREQFKLSVALKLANAI